MKKITSLILTLILIATMFTGCKKVAVDKNNNVVNGDFTEYLVAEKVGTLNRDDFMTADGGLYYVEDGLYGIISLNGANDTGAIYSNVNPQGKYFEVRTKSVSGSDDIDGINASSLVDGKGKTVIPEGYAAFKVLNERFIKVMKATERTYSEDDTVVSRSSKNDACYESPVDGLDWYKGNWYVFDTVTGKFVPGATGSKNTYITAKGRYIDFRGENDEYARVTIDETGEPLPKNAKLFDDGSYSIEEKKGEMYSADGKLMFSYNLDGYIPSNVSNGYYVAQKYTDNSTKYVVMDEKGKVISSEFDESIDIYGDIVKCGEKIYNLEGKQIIDGDYEYVYVDKMFESNWMLRNEDYYTLIDKNGSVFFNGPDDDFYDVFSSDFVASKDVDGDNYFYSYKDNDYIIEGSAFSPWIVKTESSNYLYDLVDTMTGKKLLEGYTNYTSISRNSLAYYVYAEYSGGADVYLVVSSAQLEDVTNKKNDLFDDLSAAFENEGIKVTVNKDSGENSLDSSVLFDGDSAELTDEGKTFLNKFIKVYTDVAFSGKYEGFISKTMVEGHTAPIEGSTYESGLQLSEERAANVKSYCLSSDTGVDVSKISETLEDVGYSNSKPVYDSNGKVDLAASRRVSFRFIVNIDF